MSLLKIVANGIELDFVKETLTVKTENNAISRDFKVQANTYPFLIIENEKTIQALGTRDIASINKIKTIEVLVFDGGIKYFGELQILSYIKGFRKCNLKYASALLSIMNKKISEFMPVVSVIPGETNPIPYTEKSPTPVDGSQFWKNYPVQFLDGNFPDAKWQFPTMAWRNKFGNDLSFEDPWALYGGEINKYDEDGLVENKFTISGDLCTVQNINVPSPQVFLLSPAHYAAQSMGYTLTGDFVNDEFISSLLFYSNKNNLSETNPVKEIINRSVYQNYEQIDVEEDNGFGEISITYSYFFQSTEVVASVAGTYIFDYDILEERFDIETSSYMIPVKALQIFLEGQPQLQYQHFSGQATKRYQGTVTIDVSPEDIGKKIFIWHFNPVVEDYPSYIMQKTIFDKTYHQMHPTIQLGRYVPDWTFGTYLNEIQNIFNLEIEIDDFSKKIIINSNQDTIENSQPYFLNKSLELVSYEQTPNDAFHLKYENEVDASLWITTTGPELFELQKSNFSQTLQSKFKLVPTTYTANLSEDLDSKSGIGLMIYNPVNKPFISPNYLGQTLTIDGAGGIYNKYWKLSLKFMLNSSAVELIGPFTETEKNKILRVKRIFVDNQEYIIAAAESRETDQNNFIIKFDLRSVNY